MTLLDCMTILFDGEMVGWQVAAQKASFTVLRATFGIENYPFATKTIIVGFDYVVLQGRFVSVIVFLVALAPQCIFLHCFSLCPTVFDFCPVNQQEIRKGILSSCPCEYS